MNNCENWYEMTEQALSTINKLMPVDSSEASSEPFTTNYQHQALPAAYQSTKPTSPLSYIEQEGKTASEPSAVSISHLDESAQQADVVQSGTSIVPKQKPSSAQCGETHQHPEKDAPERQVTVGRGVTLSVLMASGLLKAGDDVISFEHMGQEFTADLLTDGKIRWSKMEKVFPCLTSWVVHCKKTAFPNEKLVCSSTEQPKYKGQNMDHYKSLWLKKHQSFISSVHPNDAESDVDGQQEEKSEKNTEIEDKESELTWMLNCSSSMVNYQESVPHSKLGKRTFQSIPSLFVECSSFTKMNRIQPFRLNVTKNCILLLHFHCHLVGSEVTGYLAGKWDSSAQQLIATQAYPCKCSLGASKDETDRVEIEIMSNMDKSNLILVGWYHSHVGCQADPTLRDVEAQMEYQFQLKGYESATFQPCVGLIVSPFHMQSPAQLTSDMKIFYVYPPSEQRTLDYGMPLEVEHTISKDDYVTDRIIDEMEKLIKFYASDPDYLPKKFKNTNVAVYLNRLKNCLSPFCPSGYLSESIAKDDFNILSANNRVIYKMSLNVERLEE